MKQNYIKILPVLGLVLIMWGVFSCKDPEPPKAIIQVINENGEPVEEAMVVIRAPDSDSTHTRVYLASGVKEIADTSYTDSDGKVRKKFLYESIYRVEVTKYDNPTLRGIGVLILETDKIYEETITITPQTTF
ncbi:MAG: hypothetical protein ACP5DZ_00165 [Bacteroidales bacterium]